MISVLLLFMIMVWVKKIRIHYYEVDFKGLEFNSHDLLIEEYYIVDS
jgi:hypothetical protein